MIMIMNELMICAGLLVGKKTGAENACIRTYAHTLVLPFSTAHASLIISA